MKKCCVMVDGNAVMHRAYHGIGKGHFVPVLDDKPVGMVYGFVSTLLGILQSFDPECILVTFDTKEKTFRHEIDPHYKSQRSSAPDDFYPQLPYLYQALEAFQIPYLAEPGFESDDLIGTCARQALVQDIFENIYIASGDYDFLQLVGDRVKLLKLNGAIEKSLLMGEPETIERFGVTPQQIVDYKAIVGDSSDNYKGIEGLGPKTAQTLFEQYKTLEAIYESLESLPPKLQEKFKDQKEYVYHCKHLATIKTDIPLSIDMNLSYELPLSSAEAFLDFMRFPSLKGRLKKIQQKKQPAISNQSAPAQASLF